MDFAANVLSKVIDSLMHEVERREIAIGLHSIGEHGASSGYVREDGILQDLALDTGNNLRPDLPSVTVKQPNNSGLVVLTSLRLE